ncbi:MAG: CoB--CoM heterodisulfide reductase iron-sulfur subunit B family protein [Candidatus Edwardsbacteria bacterium]
MKYSYFPGCTLKTKAKGFEDSALAVAKALDFEMIELPHWYCCGTSFSLIKDNVMAFSAPVRNLLQAQKEKSDLTTLCSFCYNTLKRANEVMRKDAEKRKKLSDFIEEEYQGEVKVLHLLEILKNQIGFEDLKKKVKKSLKGLKVASYYGCLLLRPQEEIGLDNAENPQILENLLTALGAEVVDFPHKTECCGSFQMLNSPEVAADCSHLILRSALKNGAELVIGSCPLCQYNLDTRQKLIKERHQDFSEIPVLYFTQLLGIALGADSSSFAFEKHYVDPRPVLQKKQL